jgi:uncharacterized repeat protein (TIGR01451 family)
MVGTTAWRVPLALMVGAMSTGLVPTVASAAAKSSSPDLSIRVAAAPNPVVQENNLTYSIIVRNNGPADATKVTVRDAPLKVNFVSARADRGSCAVPDAIVCSLGTLRRSEAVRVTIVVMPLLPGTLKNTVWAWAKESDPRYGNNWTTLSTLVKPRLVDVSVSMRASPDPVMVNGVLRYSVKVANAGRWSARDVQVVFLAWHPHPLGNLIYRSVSATRGRCSSATEAVNPVTGAPVPIACQFDLLPANSSTMISIDARPTWPATSERIGAVAWVSHTWETDRNLANDAAVTFTSATSGDRRLDCVAGGNASAARAPGCLQYDLLG